MWFGTCLNGVWSGDGRSCWYLDNGRRWCYRERVVVRGDICFGGGQLWREADSGQVGKIQDVPSSILLLKLF